MTNTCAVAEFIESLRGVQWLARCGEPDAITIVPLDLVEAWDCWESAMLALWSPATHALERSAVERLGEDGVDSIFEAVSLAVDERIRQAMADYFERRPANSEATLANADRGLWPEWLETVKRDLCWAGVEAVLGQPGFFSDLLQFYRAGRWPCAWEGCNRAGRSVVF